VICRSKIVFLFFNTEGVQGVRKGAFLEVWEMWDKKNIVINELSLPEISKIVIEGLNLIINMDSEKFNFKLNSEEISFMEEFINNCKKEIISESKRLLY